mmetsp:Transcript_19932/g.43044  ORF Transcript_19932/g.43044 Transcript_19932/m.43044 type:complete len:113 (-) Transcript_19932:139-477(-)
MRGRRWLRSLWRGGVGAEVSAEAGSSVRSVGPARPPRDRHATKERAASACCQLRLRACARAASARALLRTVPSHSIPIVQMPKRDSAEKSTRALRAYGTGAILLPPPGANHF